MDRQDALIGAPVVKPGPNRFAQSSLACLVASLAVFGLPYVVALDRLGLLVWLFAFVGMWILSVVLGVVSVLFGYGKTDGWMGRVSLLVSLLVVLVFILQKAGLLGGGAT